MKKETQINIRLSETQKKQLEDKAKKSGLSLSQYMIMQGLKGQSFDASKLAKVYIQLQKIGNNINQATRIMNTYHSNEEHEFEYIYMEFLKVKAIVETYFNLSGKRKKTAKKDEVE